MNLSSKQINAIQNFALRYLAANWDEVTEGWSEAEIKARFGCLANADLISKVANSSDTAVSLPIAQTVERSMDKVAEKIPKIVVNTLKRKLNCPEMGEAIHREIESELGKESNNSGAKFLLQKMHQKSGLIREESAAP